MSEEAKSLKIVGLASIEALRRCERPSSEILLTIEVSLQDDDARKVLSRWLVDQRSLKVTMEDGI